ncbi:TolC family outer membrane protein [Camelimonas lactis]|uniref:Outer membrane protein n=1 Tax=Camelimonas lactis TaxID=659006 RepID=A0A4R2GX48_9HYPH|nr:TolC family outer membrane protein [Camelimonas lactis]TCO15035.1 outer membrane protein [Camelimonas lactis]
MTKKRGFQRSILFSTVAGLAVTFAAAAAAETMNGALAKAYMGNPTLNSQRAALRATDEGVAIAKSGMRPRVNASGSVGYTARSAQGMGASSGNADLFPGAVGVGITQPLYDGLRTLNSTRAAESQVFGEREGLRNQEQNTLLSGATAYMNVLRDTATVNLQRNNLEVLQEQLRQTRDRFNVGEVTRTDVAQAEAALAGGHSQLSAAEANLKASIAQYRQVIGEQPTKLAPGRSLESLLPKSQTAAVNLALREHPAIASALHSADAAELQIKVAEGALLPQVGLSANVSRSFDNNVRGDALSSASIVAQLTVPLYDGGQYYAQTRQAKEKASQANISVDIFRDQVRAAVVSSWSMLEAARSQIEASTAQVKANEIALAGVREEAKVGQRTTYDVLRAQQDLLQSRVLLVTAQRDRVVASYNVMAAIGRLTARDLNLRVAGYDPKVHYDQVKDKWIGLGTPGGR